MEHKAKLVNASRAWFVSRIISLCCCALFFFSLSAQALFVSPPKDPIPLIQEVFPNLTSISDKQGEPLIRTIEGAEGVLGYAFETDDIARIPAYSGEPVNMLVVIDPEGKYLASKVLEHHEPIILAGIPESKLGEFSDQYVGLSVKDRIKVGGKTEQGYVPIDGLSGATVTVMVMNVAITKAATKAAESLGIITPTNGIIQPISTIKKDIFEKKSWLDLTGDGSIRKLYLTNATVQEAFDGTKAENIDTVPESESKDMFSEVYYALADIPSIGINLFGESEYQWLTKDLQPGEHLIAVFGNGYSYKGSGYVRGGIFDRLQVHQKDNEISFRDLDHTRVTDLYALGVPRFKEMSIFKVQAHHEFDPGASWQIELLVRRQTGPIDSVFTSFKGDYDVLEHYVDTPPAIVPPKPLSLTEQVWQERQWEVVTLLSLIGVLILILFFQDILVKHPTFMHRLRHGFLVITVVFIGWTWGGQLSVVNVFTFLQSLFKGFSWDLFLLDPIIFILWCAAAVTMLLWGRAVYCGWLCPFGALQELINQVARYAKVPQFELPWAVHERLWAIKYLILLALFAISLDSLALAEQFAEIEPFKTTFLLKFDREWPFIAWAVFLLTLNLFNRKTFCRYLCPLGAALSISNSVRLFDWLKRRPECGSPCKICAKECEIQAIHPDGVINMRECHYCLDCQITYSNDGKCPPLKKMARKKRQQMSSDIPVTQL
ncbi:transcriptional regulator NosR [Vibrio tubiashii]|uniref:FMN-binding domain-containing protein n=1 Tax=Vibrio tubiashii ATCC 19109 TaxID=1051646 RepID=F9TAC8_9VIBR|nr:NosR/NirI family protein [Vibrio tubiashii]AIW14735.1 ferredoxin [Vibrio tubiashii ATCC 19109]EGU50108.1 FMN-binding domain-containing protein [Vibrio tubiashii ATCC 19109]EIF03333.1 FMN-binding domain-containing protein [Vibrio tubiashii NCIMB 1337 = ATCC 19106]